MRRVASNIVYINDIEFYKNHIVELYNHIMVNHYRLSDELAMTEWFSGTIIIYERQAFLVQRVLNDNEVKDIYKELSSAPELSTNHSCSYGNIQRL